MKTPISEKIIFCAMILALVAMGSHALQIARAQTEPVLPPAASLPSNIPPNTPLAQVVRLAQSGVDESVLLSYVNNSSSLFNLTSDQIIYLKDLGVPNDVVTAMIQRDQQLQTSAAAAAQPAATPDNAETDQVQPAEVTQNYFYDTLSPYGGWVNINGYGLCWQPTVGIYDSSWQPYCDHGQWVYTDDGWYWLSDYSWGATVFHYGRWFRDPQNRWCWWPDTAWAPSWVCWRYSDDYCGWAPLPPHAIYQTGVGLVYDGRGVSAGFNFGLGTASFVFVPTRNFCDPHPRRYRAMPGAVTAIYNHTTVINNFNANGRNGTIVNDGIPPQRLSAVTRKEIRPVAIRESSASVPRGEQLGRDALVVNRPHIQENAVSTLNRGIKPTVVRQNFARPLIINGNENEIPGQNNFSRPAARSITPDDRYSPSVPPPNYNYNYDKRITSPKQQQFESSSSRANLPDSQEPEIRAESVERPPASQPRENSRSSYGAPAPQRPDQNQNQNGPGH